MKRIDMRWELEDPGDPLHPVVMIWRSDLDTVARREEIAVFLDEDDLRVILRFVQNAHQGNTSKENP